MCPVARHWDWQVQANNSEASSSLPTNSLAYSEPVDLIVEEPTLSQQPESNPSTESLIQEHFISLPIRLQSNVWEVPLQSLYTDTLLAPPAFNTNSRSVSFCESVEFHPPCLEPFVAQLWTVRDRQSALHAHYRPMTLQFGTKDDALRSIKYTGYACTLTVIILGIYLGALGPDSMRVVWNQFLLPVIRDYRFTLSLLMLIWFVAGQFLSHLAQRHLDQSERDRRYGEEQFWVPHEDWLQSLQESTVGQVQTTNDSFMMTTMQQPPVSWQRWQHVSLVVYPDEKELALALPV